MSEIPTTTEEVEIVENVSTSQAEHRSPSGRADGADLMSRVEKIREELGILEGHVALTFIDDES
jgi:hypothetical protein